MSAQGVSDIDEIAALLSSTHITHIKLHAPRPTPFLPEYFEKIPVVLQPGSTEYAYEAALQEYLRIQADESQDDKAVLTSEARLFVGDIPWDTTEDTLRRLFSRFGTLVHVRIMKDLLSGLSRGYAFLTFLRKQEAAAAMRASQKEGLALAGRLLDVKQALPSKGSGQHVRKCFVGGLNPRTNALDLREHFSKHGEVIHAVVMTNKQNGKSRGFGFVTFADSRTVTSVLNKRHFIRDREVEVVKARSRDVMNGQKRRQNTPHTYSPPQKGRPAPSLGTMVEFARAAQSTSRFYQPHVQKLQHEYIVPDRASYQHSHQQPSQGFFRPVQADYGMSYGLRLAHLGYD